jgi:hypothetical protein
LVGGGFFIDKAAVKTMMAAMGLSSHHTTGATCDEWLTPPEIIKQLGTFDLDPCSPVNRPWPTAAKHYTIEDNGLMLNWDGRVWLNPPYDNSIGQWLEKMALHHSGISMIFARTETRHWHEWVWPFAKAILFMRGRPHFHYVDGTKAKGNSGAPVALVAYGNIDAMFLDTSGIAGKLIRL